MIGIDALSANQPTKTGVGWYAHRLIQAMKQQPLASGEQVVLYSLNKLEGALGQLPAGWNHNQLHWPPTRGWMSVRMGWEMMRRAPDVLFVPAQGLPLVTPKKTITTIHDVGFLSAPALYESGTRKRLTRALDRAVSRCKKLLVPSEFTKQELMERKHVSVDRIVVTPLGVDAQQFEDVSTQKLQEVQQRYRLGSKFFLYVGRLDEKKNIRTLIRAFDGWKAGRGVGDPYELILVGPEGFLFSLIKHEWEAAKHSGSIRTLGYVPEEELAAVMKLATAFVFPSWYEGFGLPNLEAMAAGVPVLCSDIPVHHEVCGEAAVFVTPREVGEWMDAFDRIAGSESLRQTLIERGTERIKKFTWQKTAESTWQAIRHLSN